MCVVRRMIGAEVYSVVRCLFGCGLLGLLVVLIVPFFLSFLAMPGLCCFLRVTHSTPHAGLQLELCQHLHRWLFLIGPWTTPSLFFPPCVAESQQHAG